MRLARQLMVKPLSPLFTCCLGQMVALTSGL
jgi:hypothetical protein